MGFGWALRIFSFVTGANIKKMLSFVVENWREVLIVGLAVVVLYQNTFETRWFFGSETIPALEADLVIVRNNLNTCVDGNKVLSAAIDANNEKVLAFEALTKELQGSIDVLQGELDEARDTTNTEVEVILKEPTPQSCEKAIDYLRDAGKELKW